MALLSIIATVFIFCTSVVIAQQYGFTLDPFTQGIRRPSAISGNCVSARKNGTYTVVQQLEKYKRTSKLLVGGIQAGSNPNLHKLCIGDGKLTKSIGNVGFSGFEIIYDYLPEFYPVNFNMTSMLMDLIIDDPTFAILQIDIMDVEFKKYYITRDIGNYLPLNANLTYAFHFSTEIRLPVRQIKLKYLANGKRSNITVIAREFARTSFFQHRRVLSNPESPKDFMALDGNENTFYQTPFLQCAIGTLTIYFEPTIFTNAIMVKFMQPFPDNFSFNYLSGFTNVVISTAPVNGLTYIIPAENMPNFAIDKFIIRSGSSRPKIAEITLLE